MKGTDSSHWHTIKMNVLSANSLRKTKKLHSFTWGVEDEQCNKK